jgi:cell division protein FtsX
VLFAVVSEQLVMRSMTGTVVLLNVTRNLIHGDLTMENAVQQMPIDAKNAVEVVVYVKADLGEDQRNLVISALEKTDGIIGAEFCTLRNHLMLTKYNKDIFSSQDVLKSFDSLKLEARLVGPI